MFGPNTHYHPQEPQEYCHRSKETLRLCASIKEKLTELFDLQDYDLLLIPGPATVAMETVIRSCKNAVAAFGSGKFELRWNSMAYYHNLKFDTLQSRDTLVCCLFETSTSTYRGTGYFRDFGWHIVDAVSAFPYYPIPALADVFVTTSCKLLGAPPGISIVGVVKSSWEMFAESDSECYTNIQNHRGEGFMTTAPVYVLEVLERNLQEASFEAQRDHIHSVCRDIIEVIPAEICIGERMAPALTFDKAKFDARFPGIAEKFQLYPATKPESKTYHIFTYSEHIEKYQQLIKALKAC
jgi:aspartate aminotransferase-like enzyme